MAYPQNNNFGSSYRRTVKPVGSISRDGTKIKTTYGWVWRDSGKPVVWRNTARRY